MSWGSLVGVKGSDKKMVRRYLFERAQPDGIAIYSFGGDDVHAVRSFMNKFHMASRHLFVQALLPSIRAIIHCSPSSYLSCSDTYESRELYHFFARRSIRWRKSCSLAY